MRLWIHVRRRRRRPVGKRGDDFFDAVRKQLADVPWEVRQRLLADVATRIAGLPEHTRPEVVLGDPRVYARLVREAAGFPPNRVAPFPYFRAMRRRSKILVIVVPLLLALSCTLLTAARHYQPLRAVADAGYSNAQPIQDPLVTDVDFYRYRKGAIVVTGIELKNSGRATATVTRVLLPSGSPLALVGLRAQPDVNLIGSWARATPVRRLSVHPGETVELFVVMKMITYQFGPGASVQGDLPRLEVDVLGGRHTLRPIGARIGIVGTSSSSDPALKLGYVRVAVNGVWIGMLFFGLAAGATALDRWLPPVGHRFGSGVHE